MISPESLPENTLPNSAGFADPKALILPAFLLGPFERAHTDVLAYCQYLLYLQCNCPCDRWREGVSYLPVSDGLLACELPVVGKALEPSDHRHRQARHSYKISLWRFLGER